MYEHWLCIWLYDVHILRYLFRKHTWYEYIQPYDSAVGCTHHRPQRKLIKSLSTPVRSARATFHQPLIGWHVATCRPPMLACWLTSRSILPPPSAGRPHPPPPPQCCEMPGGRVSGMVHSGGRLGLCGAARHATRARPTCRPLVPAHPAPERPRPRLQTQTVTGSPAEGRDVGSGSPGCPGCPLSALFCCDVWLCSDCLIARRVQWWVRHEKLGSGRHESAQTRDDRVWWFAELLIFIRWMPS